MRPHRSRRPARYADYLTRRGDVFYYQRAVPPELVPVIGAKRWRRSLGTRDRHEAAILARPIAADHDRQIAAARDAIDPPAALETVTRLTAEAREIEEATSPRKVSTIPPVSIPAAAELRRLSPNLARLFERGTTAALPPESDPGTAPIAADRFDEAERMIAALTAHLPPEKRDEVAAAIRRQTGIAAEGELIEATPPAPPRDDLPAFFPEAWKDQAEQWRLDRQEAAEDRKITNKRAFDRSRTDRNTLEKNNITSNAMTTAPSAITLDRLVTRYLAANPVSVEAQRLYTASAKQFTDITGKRDIAKITKADVRKFNEEIAKSIVITRIPMNVRKTITTQELIRRGEADPQNKISAKTVRMRVGSISALLGFAVSEELITFNPATGIAPPKTSLKRRRTPEEYDYSKLLKALEITRDEWGRSEKPVLRDRYWLFLILAFTGMRLEEAAHLLSDDLTYHHDGTPIINLREHDGRRLKTENSRRIVPVPARLIEAGIFDLAAAQRAPEDRRLLAALPVGFDGRVGKGTSKLWRDLLERRTPGLRQSGDISVHAFRHHFKTAARDAEVPPNVYDAIQGHSNGSSVSAGYGKQISPKVLKTWIDRIDPFPDFEL